MKIPVLGRFSELDEETRRRGQTDQRRIDQLDRQDQEPMKDPAIERFFELLEETQRRGHANQRRIDRLDQTHLAVGMYADPGFFSSFSRPGERDPTLGRTYRLYKRAEKIGADLLAARRSAKKLSKELITAKKRSEKVPEEHELLSVSLV